MRALVTGADGCVGGHIAEALRAAGHDVLGCVFDRPPGESEQRLDLRSEESVRALPRGHMDVVVHAAGLVDHGVPAALMEEVNHGGTRRILRWAERAGVAHFVQISSISVYGPLTMGGPRTERGTPVLGRWLGLPYMRSKARAEHAVQTSSVPWTILRPPAVLAAGDTVLTPAILGALRTGAVPYAGSREAPVSIVQARNLASAVVRLLEVGPLHAALNCSDEALPWKQIVERYAHCAGLPLRWQRASLGNMARRLHDDRYLLLLTHAAFGAHNPADRLHRALDWKPPIDWKTGIRVAVEASVPEAAADAIKAPAAPRTPSDPTSERDQRRKRS